MRHRLAPLLALLLIAACGSGSAQPALQDGVVHVVAAESTWGDIARQIGAPHVRVTSVLEDPGTDPHTFETDPKTAALVSNAGFVITNGLGYDAFADKLLAAGGGASRRVLTIAKAVDASGNPHLWYSPSYVDKGARAIAAELSRIDPADASSFATGLAAFLSGYQQYVDLVDQIKLAHAGEKVAYTEAVPGYLVEAAGLSLGTPESFARAVENGNDPSPADVDAFRTALQSGQVRALLYNDQVTSPLTEQVKGLAEKARVPVVAMSELPPAGMSFLQWQKSQTAALLAALG